MTLDQHAPPNKEKILLNIKMLISSVVILWAGGPDNSISRVLAPQYLRKKGLKVVLKA